MRLAFIARTARRQVERERSLRLAAEATRDQAIEDAEHFEWCFNTVVAARDELARRLEGAHRVNTDLLSGAIRSYPVARQNCGSEL